MTLSDFLGGLSSAMQARTQRPPLHILGEYPLPAVDLESGMPPVGEHRDQVLDVTYSTYYCATKGCIMDRSLRVEMMTPDSKYQKAIETFPIV